MAREETPGSAGKVGDAGCILGLDRAIDFDAFDNGLANFREAVLMEGEDIRVLLPVLLA